MKNRTVKILVLSLVCMIGLSPVLYADSGNNEPSMEDLTYQSSDESDYTSSVKVSVKIPSTYKITIPKKIDISGVTKKANYYVKVEGEISDTAAISVVPDETIEFKSKGANLVFGTITQDKVQWKYDDLDTNAIGEIDASNLRAGEWEGSFNFNIAIEGILGDVIDVNGQTAEADDVQTWLKCAGIKDKDYTTLNEVLEDEETLAKLIANKNAVDYMVRSKNWISSNGLVPNMLSNTLPEGSCISSSNYSGYQPYYAFADPAPNAGWAPSNGSNQFVGYILTEPKIIKHVSFDQGTEALRYRQVYIQASTDGTSWVNLTSAISIDKGVSQIDVDNNDVYIGYRLFIPSGTSIIVRNLQFYEFSKGIIEDETAMRLIGNSNYASTTLLHDIDWRNAIVNSEYNDYIN